MSRPWRGERPKGWQSQRRPSRLRPLIAHEAARQMVEEEVRHYLDAKQVASRAVLGRAGSRTLRYRPRDLPSNGEIRARILDLSQRYEGAEARARQLFCMRLLALRVMEALPTFRPRLIGSVGSGHIRRGSDVDLHVFTDQVARVEAAVDAEGWPWHTERVDIRQGNEIRSYHHVHLDLAWPVELSVYPLAELRARPRSSTDGKPIDRMGLPRLRALLEREHGLDWGRVLAGEEVPELDGWGEE